MTGTTVGVSEKKVSGKAGTLLVVVVAAPGGGRLVVAGLAGEVGRVFLASELVPCLVFEVSFDTPVDFDTEV